VAGATAAASVTGSSGGESIRTTSYMSRSCATCTTFMCWDASSSLGFGGSGPLASTSNTLARPRLAGLLQAHPAGEDTGQPDGRLETEQVGGLGGAQVPLDRQHLAPGRRQRDCEVAQGGGLPLPW